MKEKTTKKVKLEAKLKVYSQIAMKIASVLDGKMSVEELDDYVFNKISKIDKEIFGLVDKRDALKDLTPKYGPGDDVYYNGVEHLVMSVNHANKTYDLKSSNFREWVSWSLIK